MFASSVLAISLLSLPTWSFITDPPTTAPSDTISECTSWTISQRSDNCELLAKRSQVSLGKLLSYNPSLVRDCSTPEGYSYCIEKKLERSRARNARKDLTAREDSSNGYKLGQLIKYLFLDITSPLLTIIQLWNRRVPSQFNSLSYADFADYLQRSADGQAYRRNIDPSTFGEFVACNLKSFNDKVEAWKKGYFLCTCYSDTCCATDEECPNFNVKRFDSGLGLDSPGNVTLEQRDNYSSGLERRADTYTWDATAPDGSKYSGAYTAIDWPGPSDFKDTDWIWQHVMTTDIEDICTVTTVREYTYAQIMAYIQSLNNPAITKAWQFVQVEHYVEKNMVAKFTKDVIEQKLPSGQPFTSAAGIPPSFFTSFMTTNIAGLQNVKTVPGAQNELMPRARLMHTLGTKKYRDNFLLLQSNLNNMKEGVLKGDNPVAPNKMTLAMENPRIYITYLRQVFGVIGYLNYESAIIRGENIIRAMRWEWSQYAEQYKAFNNGNKINIVQAWDDWYKDYMQTRLMATKQWIINHATDGLVLWQGFPPDTEEKTAEDVNALYLDRADGLGGLDFQTYPTGDPTPPP